MKFALNLQILGNMRIGCAIRHLGKLMPQHILGHTSYISTLRKDIDTTLFGQNWPLSFLKKQFSILSNFSN